ncbi:hypothetical protein M514_12257 [Trichuris suis]|uniref:Uncharacterized protein n=1 Tax=Trichuris suis TaxID=68888 RepID=A0A085MTH2_9BILA|nr:hypothetical protein M513_12257 [Trichuris suis]KFD60518.1 hypothetical protein M514_12257 [Trichuris suis]
MQLLLQHLIDIRDRGCQLSFQPKKGVDFKSRPPWISLLGLFSSEVVWMLSYPVQLRAGVRAEHSIALHASESMKDFTCADNVYRLSRFIWSFAPPIVRIDFIYKRQVFAACTTCKFHFFTMRPGMVDEVESSSCSELAL